MEKIGPVPSGCGEKSPILCCRPCAWNHQTLRTPPRLGDFSPQRHPPEVVLTGPRVRFHFSATVRPFSGVQEISLLVELSSCLEFMLRMTRFVACVSAFLLSCCAAAAQNPAPASASVQPNVTSAESPAIRDFQKVEDAWSEAVNQRDQYGLELVLSPLFVDVSATGDITTRNQQ